MTARNLAYAAAALVLIVGAAFLFGKTYNSSGLNLAGATWTSDDLDGKIDGRIKRALEPVTNDVATLKRDTKALKDGFTETNERMDGKFKEQKEVLTGIAKLLEDMKAGKTTPPSTTTPSAPAMSALEQKRWATIRAECLPEDQQNLDLGDSLSDEAFNAQVAHCKAQKLAKQRMVSPPPAAGRQQVAQNDPQAEPEAMDGDPDALDENGQPRVQAVGYNGVPQHGYGHGGARRCSPGTRPAGSFGCVGRTITNRAETQVFDQRIPSGCVPGQVREIWKEGVDQQRRRVRYKITQHSECGPRQRAY